MGQLDASLEKLLADIRTDLAELEGNQGDRADDRLPTRLRTPRSTPPPLPQRSRAGSEPESDAPGPEGSGEATRPAAAPLSNALIRLTRSTLVGPGPVKTSSPRRESAAIAATLTAATLLPAAPRLAVEASRRRTRRRRKVALAALVALAAGGVALAALLPGGASAELASGPDLAAPPVAALDFAATAPAAPLALAPAAPTASADADGAPPAATPPPRDPPRARRPAVREAIPSASPPALAPTPDGDATGASACDEVACLTDGIGCCEQYAELPDERPIADLAEPTGPAPAAPLPARPDRAALMTELRGHTASLIHCAESAGLRGAVTLDVAISSDGSLTSVQVAGQHGLAACAADVLESARFPASRDGARIRYPVVVR